MKIFNCVIADDEPCALDILENYIGKVDRLHLITRCSDGFQVYNVLHKSQIDVLFLDIEMPQLSGLDLFRSLANPPKIIFTTAYKEHAVSAFELNAVDYLLKPFSFERFLKSVDRLVEPEPASSSDQESTNKFLEINIDRQKVRILLKDINYIEGLGNYLKVHTQNKFYVTLLSIRAILEKLPQEEFKQIHKSYIVPFSKVQSYNYLTLVIEGVEIPIGRSYRQNLFP